MLTRPPTLADNDHHEGAMATAAVLTALIEAAGLLSTKQVGEAAGLGEDKARRLCRTLAAIGWVARVEVDGRDAWSIGPELPRIGLAYQRLLVAQAEALAARHAELLAPIRRGGA